MRGTIRPVILRLVLRVVLPVVLGGALGAGTLAAPPGETVTVPFVGCPSDGQVGPREVPRREPKAVKVAAGVAREIAYYEGGAARRAGVFAPRGWHCFQQYGSSGEVLLVASGPIVPGEGLEWSTTGPAVEREYKDGGTSGRFTVARYASRLFPRLAADFIARIKRENVVPASEIESPPFPDQVRYPARGVAEFTTPAHADGFGTQIRLRPSGETIRGVAVLLDEGYRGINVVRLRLGAGREELETVLLRLNRESAMGLREP